MYTGGDGYTVFAQGTNVQRPGDDLLEVAVSYAHGALDLSLRPVEGRIVKQP